jgi:hypothetical protein
MCYTAFDSGLAYIINTVSSLYLYKYSSIPDYKIYALFFLFVGQMQLFDMIFWLNDECTLINKLVTKLAIVFNHLQPVVLYLLVKKYNKKLNLASRIVIYIYILVMLIYTVNLWPSVTCTKKDKVCCSLPLKVNNNKEIINWEWTLQSNSHIMYFMFIVSFVLSATNIKVNNLIFIIATIVSFMISYKIPVLNQGVGRIWCYFAAFAPLIFIVLDKFKVNINLDDILR